MGKDLNSVNFGHVPLEANQTAAYGRGTDSSILYSIYVRLLWAPAQHKRATMLYIANVLFIYLFFYGRLILRPWLTEVRENFTRGRP